MVELWLTLALWLTLGRWLTLGLGTLGPFATPRSGGLLSAFTESGLASSCEDLEWRGGKDWAARDW